MKILGIGFGAALLAGCATAPEVYQFDRTVTVSEGKDAVWERAVEFFAANNLSIKTIEKDSGIIGAERLVGSPSPGGLIGSWASCGSAPLEIPVRQTVDLNVFVRPVSPESTSVTVNTRFSETRQFGQQPATTVDCNSTGALEREILAAVSASR